MDLDGQFSLLAAAVLCSRIFKNFGEQTFSVCSKFSNGAAGKTAGAENSETYATY